MKVLIIESPSANLHSIYIALQRIQTELDFDLTISIDAEKILAADRVIFPGVGHASFIMQELRKSGLDQIIPQIDKPLMGICLGMQLLFEHFSEGQELEKQNSQTTQNGLGLLPGNVVALRPAIKQKLAVPHMGWNSIHPMQPTDYLKLCGDSQNTYCYFVHSFFVSPSELTLAYSQYGDTKISAIVRGKEKPHIWGCQFHPEKSGTFGAQILRNWLYLDHGLQNHTEKALKC